MGEAERVRQFMGMCCALVKYIKIECENRNLFSAYFATYVYVQHISPRSCTDNISSPKRLIQSENIDSLVVQYYWFQMYVLYCIIYMVEINARLHNVCEVL